MRFENLNFVGPVSTSLSCPICQNVFDDPIITSHCHHSFCRTCIERSLQQDPHCPLCRTYSNLQDIHTNLALKGLVGELLVHCPHTDCPAKISFDQLDQHIITCEYKPAPCRFSLYGCNFNGPNIDMHEKTCIFLALESYIKRTEERLSTLERLLLKPKQPFICSKTITGNVTGVTSIELYNDLIYNGCYDGSLNAFDMNGTRVFSGNLHGGANKSIWSLCFLNNSLYSSGTDSDILVWDTQLNFKSKLQGHKGKVYNLCTFQDKLISGSSDATIKIWDGTECKYSFLGHLSGINSIIVDGDVLVSTSNDKTVRVWNLQTQKLLKTLQLPSEVLCVTQNDLFYFVSTFDAHIYVIDKGSLIVNKTLKGHKWEIWSLAASSHLLFSGSHDHTIRQWDVRNWSSYELLGHKGYIHALTYKSLLYSGCADKTIKVWKDQE